MKRQIIQIIYGILFWSVAQSFLVVQAQKNHILTQTILKEGVKTETAADALQITQGDIMENVVYFDGLGREIQSVVTQGSPDQKDIIQVITYDSLGRRLKQYLPYTQGNQGTYRPDALTEQAYFYQHEPHVAHTQVPFAETVFENAPLSRVLEQGAAGESWQIEKDPDTGISTQQGKTIKTKPRVYVQGDVQHWKVGYTLRATPTTAQLYNTGDLWIQEITDEHHHLSRTYTDKRGLVVLKRSTRR